jgi:hypothetical protein
LFVGTTFADQNSCTIATVKGTYGYVGFGTVLATNPFGAPAGSYSSTGTLTFDGKGNLLIVDTGRVDNLFTSPDTQYPSTYTVSNDCVVTFTITAWAELGLPGPHYKGVIVNNRKELRAISLVPGYIVNYVNTAKITAEDSD